MLAYAANRLQIDFQQNDAQPNISTAFYNPGKCSVTPCRESPGQGFLHLTIQMVGPDGRTRRVKYRARSQSALDHWRKWRRMAAATADAVQARPEVNHRSLKGVEHIVEGSLNRVEGRLHLFLLRGLG